MQLVARIFVGVLNGRVDVKLNWRAIKHQSVVLVSASEGRENVNEAPSSYEPNRFVGYALITVHNIAPFDGGVSFVLTVNWDEPLPIWADVVLLDKIPTGWVTAT